MTWRTARSLDVLLAEINAHAPHRSKVSDGSIGDPAHSARTSDHNPNPAGVVRARDFTHDPAGGLDCNDLAERLLTAMLLKKHPALASGAYIIWDRRIISRDRIREGWRTYTGSNPHTKHLHLSVTTVPSSLGYDSRAPWNLWPKPKPTLPPTQLSKLRDKLRALKLKAKAKGKTGRQRKIRDALRELPKR